MSSNLIAGSIIVGSRQKIYRNDLRMFIEEAN
jgi:hypothetical protein